VHPYIALCAHHCAAFTDTDGTGIAVAILIGIAYFIIDSLTNPRSKK